jgi:hypothetical protein
VKTPLSLLALRRCPTTETELVIFSCGGRLINGGKKYINACFIGSTFARAAGHIYVGTCDLGVLNREPL